MTHPSNERHPVKACLVCNGAKLYYLFSISDHRIVRCDDCGLLFINPQPSDDELSQIYGADYFLGSETETGRQTVSEIKQATAQLYLSEIRRYRGCKNGRLLEVGCGDGDFLVSAETEGWSVTGVEYSAAACEKARQRLKAGKVFCGELSSAGLDAQQFDLCVISDVIGHVRSPLDFLREIHRVLKPGGTLFIATPSTDSWSARFMRQKWMEFKPEHLAYFDRQTIQTALFKSGFHDVIVQPGWKILNFDYVKMHFDRFPVPLVTPIVEFYFPRSAAKRAAPASPDRRQRHHGFFAKSGIAVAASAFRHCSRIQRGATHSAR